MKLNARKMGSIKAVKDTLKKGGSSGGGAAYIKNVPADGITVRFLTEPEDWFGYYEYFDAAAKAFVPMTEGEILPDGSKPSFRYLANALDISTDRVIPLKLAKTAANALILKYDKYDTMCDRNYELQRHGEGLDTTYDVTPEAPSKMNLAKYEMLDLEAILIAAREQATGEVAEGSAPDDEKPSSGAKKVGSATKKVAAKSKPTAEYDEEILFPGGEYRYDYSKDELLSMPEEDVLGLVDWWELEDTEDNSKNIRAILDAQAAHEEEEGDDEEDEDDEEVEEDEDDDEDEEVEYDEDSLRAMSIRELRLIAESLEIDFDKGATKNVLVDLIIEAAEE